MNANSIAAICVCVIFPVLAGIAVALRLHAQKNLKRNTLGLDDYFIFAGEVRS